MRSWLRWPERRPWHPYAAAACLVGVVTGAGTLFRPGVDPANLVMLYLLVVVITGLRWGRGAAVLSSVLGVLAFDFFLVPPHLTFAVADAQYFITFAGLLAVALAIGTLTGRLRDHSAMLRRREQETAALYAFSRSMVAASDLPAIAAALVTHVGECLGQPAAVYFPDGARLALQSASPGFTPGPGQLAAAERAYAAGESWGWEPPAGGDPEMRYIPLRTPHGTAGVLAVRVPGEPPALTPRHRRLAEAFAAQAAVVLERVQLAEAARRARLLEEAERLHDALLHSISHALRTPLAAIIGSLSTLTEPGHQDLNRETQTELLDTAREEAERLNWLVSNLLDMTRLESGHLKLTTDWHDLEDVIGVALSQTAGVLKGRPVQVRMPPALPLVPLDLVLIVQVLDNLLTNAAKYSPPGAPIEIRVQPGDQTVAVQIADRGTGIPAGDLARVFEKFYRAEQPGHPSGTGLGLAICKGIVEAHRGRIWAEPRAGGGTVVAFALPLRGRDAGAGGRADG